MSDHPIAVDLIRRDIAEERAEGDGHRRKAEASDERVDMLEQLLVLAEKAYGGQAVDGDAVVSEGGRSTGAGPAGQAPALAGVDAYEGMLVVLAESETKMSLPEIADRMLALGWQTRANQPTETLRVALRRDDDNRIVRVNRGFYELRPSGTPDTLADPALATSSPQEPQIVHATGEEVN